MNDMINNRWSLHFQVVAPGADLGGNLKSVICFLFCMYFWALNFVYIFSVELLACKFKIHLIAF